MVRATLRRYGLPSAGLIIAAAIFLLAIVPTPTACPPNFMSSTAAAPTTLNEALEAREVARLQLETQQLQQQARYVSIAVALKGVADASVPLVQIIASGVIIALLLMTLALVGTVLLNPVPFITAVITLLARWLQGPAPCPAIAWGQPHSGQRR